MSNDANKVHTDQTLVLGAGQLGMAVLRQLAPRLSGDKLTVFVSKSSLETPNEMEKARNVELRALDVDIQAVDLVSSSVDELADIFRKFCTVINCTGFVAGPGTQIKVTKAVFKAGIERYFPWQFGVDYDIVGKGSGQPVFDEQYEVRGLLRSQKDTEWVIISTGMFTSFLFEPAFGLVDFEQKILKGLGSWETKVTVTTPEDIGLITTEIFFESPRIKNEVVFIASDTVSYGQLADVVEEVAGERFQRELLTHDELAADLMRYPSDVMARYRVAFARGDGMWWEKSTTYNEIRRISTTDVKSWLKNRRLIQHV